MANEKKNEGISKEELEKANAAVAKEADVDVVEDTSGEIVTDLQVAREEFEYNGEVRYNYFVKAMLGGKEVKADLVSSDLNDIGAFDVFNTFYDLSDGKLQFRLVPWTRKADKKGEEDKSGFTYKVASPIAPEAIFIKVKPKAESDKAIVRAVLYLSGYKI